MRFMLRAFLLTALGLTVCGSAAAQDTTKIRFTLDWKMQGLHAWYYWAQDKGYFAAEKLDVTIDQGEGSAVTVTRVTLLAAVRFATDITVRVPVSGAAEPEPLLQASPPAPAQTATDNINRDTRLMSNPAEVSGHITAFCCALKQSHDLGTAQSCSFPA